jgi:hypothetical protein
MNQVPSRIAWHFDVHTACGEMLRYFLLSIHPTYHRQSIFESIKAFCRKQGLTSYGIYEVYGPVDLIFSAWIPTATWNFFIENFREWANSVTNRAHVGNLGVVDIERCHYHWLWDDQQGGHVCCKPDVQSLLWLRQQLNDPNSEYLLKRNDSAIIDELSRRHLLRSYEAAKPEVRFTILVSHPQHSIPGDAREETTQRIIHNVLSVEDLSKIAIYESSGQQWLLIDASVVFNDYHSIATLQTRINESGIRGFSARTTTYLCEDNLNAVQEVVELNSRDRPPLRVVDENYLRELLSRDESPQLEFKGSLRINMHNFWERGDRKPDTRLEHKILETIVGFLNSFGGELVIGALEPGRLAEKFPDQIGKLPVVGRFRLMGIDVDFVEKGFDAFQLHLGNLFRDRIGVVASQIAIHQISLEGKLLCLIRVPRSTENQYLDETYFAIRDGASTRIISGAAQEEYQRDRRET